MSKTLLIMSAAIVFSYAHVLILICFSACSNRAECHLRSKNPKRAIHDCNRSLCLDTAAKVKVQWRRSRAYQKLNLDYPAWLDMK